MPLTLAELHARTFSTVRLRQGYDEGEVDEFLDRAEAELVRLSNENEHLRAAIAAALLRPAATAASTGTPGRVLPSPRQTERRAPNGAEEAARALELAQRIADRAVEGAHAEARSVIAAARARAEAVEGAARDGAHALEHDTRAWIQEVIGGLEATRSALEAGIQGLRSFESEQHHRRRSYLEQQLRRLRPPTGDGSAAVERGPAAADLHPVRPRPSADPPPGMADPRVTALPHSVNIPIPGLLLKRVAATVHRAAVHCHPAR
ncbi:DivIVA domain-containing protein [Streptomyces sp. BE303]|uniref:DivIVA domain-containing protein n=1 Tax=Streptomyces sp. BE303 TaxID=3002528 RepID=UPI002E79741C|nr:DivIVA domain-containing protein [Streptomyces sp. BE303]MED7954627.1 DivIVA domain-containing protein [Streptomyces sp. BE303]